MTTPEPGFPALEQRRSHLQSVAENTARYASSFVTWKTEGWGEFLCDEVQYFDTTFIKQPSVAHSFSLDGDVLVPGRFPRVTAGVHKWLTNHEGFFTGAWLFFVVETTGIQNRATYVLPTSADGSVGLVTAPVPIPPDPNYEIVHSFIFTGVAMKAIPAYILEA